MDQHLLCSLTELGLMRLMVRDRQRRILGVRMLQRVEDHRYVDLELIAVPDSCFPPCRFVLSHRHRTIFHCKDFPCSPSHLKGLSNRGKASKRLCLPQNHNCGEDRFPHDQKYETLLVDTTPSRRITTTPLIWWRPPRRATCDSLSSDKVMISQSLTQFWLFNLSSPIMPVSRHVRSVTFGVNSPVTL